ncbi:DUF1460 domain-containing protein [Kamptonema cortianum]|nr:N-acetylmuramoyl-L-alanine amidase-like domain-containing protein [Oscillatoria laete-virens]MDK3157954.1 DUF1460 domain-containing protein [Kamptonema cortianum]MDL5046079.1 DUF1460 domain-containing protein [Oscillatoria amoena NRMC-F 0135]MDL5052785.1 DUF1460 domain-containing protein [Oscillatoria laete-virens NRMC-F 0139]
MPHLRSLLLTLALGLFTGLLPMPEATAQKLPFNTVFKGTERFDRLLKEAREKNWAALPLGDRTVAVGLALCGTPYKGHTLEIHNHIEAPSVNFYGMDCWTFFEIALNFARMLDLPPARQTPQTLLKLIEIERYRGGKCDGSYISRIHFLEELFYDNEKRGLLTNITRSLGGVRIHRRISYMSNGWRDYRYLRHNPSLRPQMAQVERRVSALPVYYIPKSKVAGIEPKLRNGDIIAIVGSANGSYTTHVGLAYRDKSGVLRFMHATSAKGKGRQCIVDSRLRDYLFASKKRAGIIVARPNPLPPAIAASLR